MATEEFAYGHLIGNQTFDYHIHHSAFGYSWSLSREGSTVGGSMDTFETAQEAFDDLLKSSEYT